MLMRTSSMHRLDDPLSAALQPPPNETKKQRALRLKAEAEAKRLSDQIDEELKREWIRLKLRDKDIKVLLLGEAESMMKQFQLLYKPHLTEQECISLKTVIYLKVVRALKYILTTLEACDDTAEDETDYSPELHTRRSGEFSDRLSLDAGASQIADLRRKLGPLVSVDGSLVHCLHDGKQGRDSQGNILAQNVAHMLWTLEKDITELRDHTTVKALIAKRRLKLDKGSEFFLEHISRVADLDYSPTIDDILYARIRTMGVQEHVFDINICGKPVTWHLYDVGGARGKRHSWVPYFDDIDAVIFVVPINDIDQRLQEDPHFNRIEYSLQRFTQLCSNPLLKSTSFMVILSNIDLLKRKLNTGLEVRKYVPSFGERKNDCVTVIQFFRKHFSEVYRRHNTDFLYTHATDIVDAKAMHCIINMVTGSIHRRHLKLARLD